MSDFETQVISTAKAIRERAGGIIFAFPIEENNPFSSYAVVVYMAEADKYFVCPKAEDISLASAGVLQIMELFRKEGIKINYDRDVRLVSYQAQMDAPSTVMRQLKKECMSKPAFEKIVDISEGDEETGKIISARGVIKFSYLAMVDDRMPKAIQFMNEYYRLLAMRKYGKTASAIRQEVRKMSKDQAIKWIESTYKRYIHDDMEIVNIFNRIAAQK